MTAVQFALDELREDLPGWEDGEPVTVVEGAGSTSPSLKSRSPEDGEVEKIALHLRHAGELLHHTARAEFFGPLSWTLAKTMLTAWGDGLKRGADDAVDFTVRFHDAETFTGRVRIRKQSERDLASVCRKFRNFRDSFCPNLTDQAARPMFRFFLENYSVPQGV